MRRTKSRREDSLPLPAATGRAIADYLRLERQQTDSRAVFVRHGTPRGLPIGPDCVAKTIRQSCACGGLPYTLARLLRHYSEFRIMPSSARDALNGRAYAAVRRGLQCDRALARP